MSCPNCQNNFLINISKDCNTCLTCNTKWNQHTNVTGTCMNCKSNVDMNLHINLLKDERTDWRSCNNCGLYLNSDMINITKNDIVTMLV